MDNLECLYEDLIRDDSLINIELLENAVFGSNQSQYKKCCKSIGITSIVHRPSYICVMPVSQKRPYVRICRRTILERMSIPTMTVFKCDDADIVKRLIVRTLRKKHKLVQSGCFIDVDGNLLSDVSNIIQNYKMSKT